MEFNSCTVKKKNNRNMNSKYFYNKFYSKSISSKKIIKRDNFTYRPIIDFLEKHIPKTKCLKILDYGCGVGTISLYLSSLGNNVIGVDISEKAILTAEQSLSQINKKLKIKFLSLKNNKYKYQKYDLIICSEVLEHIKNDNTVANDLINLTKKNGYIFISVPSNKAPLNRLGLTRVFDRRVGHLRRYSKEDLFCIFEKKKNNKILFIEEHEGILRNALYVFPSLSKFIRFLKYYLADLFLYVDNWLVRLFGGSNYYVLIKKL